MPALIEQTRKRPVNLTLNEALVAQAKAYTSNLSMVSVALNQLVEGVGALADQGQAIADAVDELWTWINPA